jgi:hypothetical protein
VGNKEFNNWVWVWVWGLDVWMFIIRGVENGNPKNGKKGKKEEREREREFILKFFCLYF